MNAAYDSRWDDPSESTSFFPPDWYARIRRVKDAYGSKCSNVECSEYVAYVVHSQPPFQGGSHALDNLRACCRECYLQKLTFDLVPAYDSPAAYPDYSDRVGHRYPPDWKYRSRIVQLEDDETCQECGAKSGSHVEGDAVALNAHHLIHLSQGGDNRLDNLTTVCEVCHTDIHGFLVGSLAEEADLTGEEPEVSGQPGGAEVVSTDTGAADSPSGAVETNPTALSVEELIAVSFEDVEGLGHTSLRLPCESCGSADLIPVFDHRVSDPAEMFRVRCLGCDQWIRTMDAEEFYACDVQYALPSDAGADDRWSAPLFVAPPDLDFDSFIVAKQVRESNNGQTHPASNDVHVKDLGDGTCIRCGDSVPRFVIRCDYCAQKAAPDVLSGSSESVVRYLGIHRATMWCDHCGTYRHHKYAASNRDIIAPSNARNGFEGTDPEADTEDYPPWENLEDDNPWDSPQRAPIWECTICESITFGPHIDVVTTAAESDRLSTGGGYGVHSVE